MNSCPIRKEGHHGFTLMELLIVVGIISLLTALLIGVLGGGREAANRAACSGRMRQLAAGVALYASDHDGFLPRSQHSAVAHGEVPWGRALAPYLGDPATGTPGPGSLFECPSHRHSTGWSYGLNVYFELGPEDDYEGSPQTWRKFSVVPEPGQTVLFGEIKGSVDHFMAHFWDQGSPPEVDVSRHGGQCNYAMVDGRVVAQSLTNTYDPSRSINLWNPGR